MHNMTKEHFVGAASELSAAKYYLSRGNQVYFPVVQQGPVDFVVQSGDTLLKVQVKTATWSKSGGNKYLQCRTRLTNKYKDYLPKQLYDILFVVSDIGYWEIPAELITSSNLSLANTGNNKCQWNDYIITRRL